VSVPKKGGYNPWGAPGRGAKQRFQLGAQHADELLGKNRGPPGEKNPRNEGTTQPR